jgi:hypothetical protein
LHRYPEKEPFHVLIGTVEFEQFGYSFDMVTRVDGRGVIAVSSLTKAVRLEARGGLELRNGGEVNVFKLFDDFGVVANVKSDRSFASFGSKVKVNAFKWLWL